MTRLFELQDAGPWTCPNCKVVHPYHRFDRKQRAAMEAEAAKLPGWPGDAEYADGTLRCMLCLAFRRSPTGETPE